MSSRAQHYREAERQLADIAEVVEAQRAAIVAGGEIAHDGLPAMVAIAQVHATLANTPHEAYNEYLDLMGMEHMREEVAHTPDAGSRGWLVDDEPRCVHCGVVGGGHAFDCITRQ